MEKPILLIITMETVNNFEMRFMIFFYRNENEKPLNF